MFPVSSPNQTVEAFMTRYTVTSTCEAVRSVLKKVPLLSAIYTDTLKRTEKSDLEWDLKN